LKLAYCLIFAKKEFAKDIIEKIVFFCNNRKNQIKPSTRFPPWLNIMIKYHFDGNHEKIRELIIMIIKAVHETKTDEIPSLEKMETYNHELECKTARLRAEITQKEKEITKKDKELTQKDNEIRQKDAKIKELLEILSKNGIVL
jgi:hypothetical protein